MLVKTTLTFVTESKITPIRFITIPEMQHNNVSE